MARPVRRGDLEMLATPDLVVETGDRLVVLAPTDRLMQVRAHFGDSIGSNAEFSCVSVGIGMVLGLALGAVPIPVPGLGTLTLGVAAGPLIVALALGWLGRTDRLADAGARESGAAQPRPDAVSRRGRDRRGPALHEVASTGIPILLAGAAVLLTDVLIVLLVGYYLMRLPYDSLIRVVSGTTGNPAIPAYGSRLLQSDRVDVEYATNLPIHDDREGGRRAGHHRAQRRRTGLTEVPCTNARQRVRC